MSGGAAAAIAPARALAFDVVRATFEDGAHTERAFREAADAAGLAGRDRAQAQRLAYGSVQRRGTSDAAIARLAGRPVGRLDPPLRAVLRVGLFELLFADATPDHAAVDQAVELAKAAGAGHASGLVNAVLRRATRERKALVADLLSDDSTPERAAVAHSMPEWLARMWWEELGPSSARSLLAAGNEPQQVAMRVAPSSLRGKSDMGVASLDARIDPVRERVLARLRDAGVDAAPAEGPWPLAPPEVIVFAGRAGEPVPSMVAAGDLTPQSRGSAAVVEVLDPQPGDHVLDLCAGPGTKTGQIAFRMGDRGETISVEMDPDRAGGVAAQSSRLGLRSVTVIEADAAGAGFDAAFDRVLVDAPCSDLGTLASRPDARWRKSPKLIERLVEVQKGILARAARSLRPGGTMVYSTCTVSRRENEELVLDLLGSSGRDGAPPLEADDLGVRAPGLASDLDSRFLQIRPDRDRTTGFFIARLIRPDHVGDRRASDARSRLR